MILRPLLQQEVLLATAYPTSYGAQVANLDRNCSITQSSSCSGFWSCHVSLCEKSSTNKLTVIRPNRHTNCNVTISIDDLSEELRDKYRILLELDALISELLAVCAFIAILHSVAVKFTGNNVLPAHLVIFATICAIFLCYLASFREFVGELRMSIDDHPPAVINVLVRQSMFTLGVVTVAEMALATTAWSTRS